MSYNKKIWANGDLITKEGMNNIEDGIYNAHEEINTLKNNTSTGGSNINDTAASATTTYSSNKIENIKESLNSQIKEVANKGTTLEVIERVAQEELTKQINAGTLKLGDIGTDDVKVFNSEEGSYEFTPNGAMKLDVSDLIYCNQYTFDKDITLKTLILTVNSKTTGEKQLNFIIVDKDMNVVDNSTLSFNVAQTGIQNVTISLGGKALAAGSYICLQSVGDYKVRYGGHDTCTIRSVNVNETTASFSQTVANACLLYTIEYTIVNISMNLTTKLNDYVQKKDLPAEVQAILAQATTTNRLYGKKIIAIGDSMVQGHTISRDKGWLAKIANRNNMTYVNYGINGTFMTNKLYGESKGVVERCVDMDKDADYVIVFAGTNDAYMKVTIGENDSTNPAQFKGALNIICSYLLTTYPTAKIMFITPYLRNEEYRQYAQAIHDICEDKYSIRVYDNIKYGGICWSNEAQVAALTLNDSYHLNLAGMEYASYKYEEELKRL